MSRLADEMEAGQLARAAEVLREAREALSNPLAPHGELRYAVLRLVECLEDALRVAESRGMRLPVPDADDDSGEAPALSVEASS